jgi:deoxyribonuclease-4
MRLRFGTSGIPRSTRTPGTDHGIRRARELGLDCLEMAWVRGVRMGAEAAERIAAAARETGLELTAHGPYYVNLCGSADVTQRSLDRLLHTARLAERCGARSLCFHAGFYQTLGPHEADRRVSVGLAWITAQLRREGVRVDVRPELTGKPSQVGSLDEILAWSEAIEGVRPCVDFSHQYARHGGAFNTYQEFGQILERIRDRLGDEALQRLHVHIAGIEFGPRGERRHLPLRQSRFRYRELLRALKDCRVSGWVVCESPAMEDDALLLQRAYRRLR